MSIFRLQNNTPSVYVNNSRDFQFLCRAFDCINASVRSEIGRMVDVIDTDTCVDLVIELLQTKLGFFTSKQYNNDSIRTLLKCFPQLVRNKGTKKAIEQAVYAYLKSLGVVSKVIVLIDKPNHTISIGISSTPIETKLLEELLSYIIPTGFFVNFLFYKEKKCEDHFVTNNKVYALNIGNILNSQVANERREFVDGPTISDDQVANLAQMVGLVEIPNNGYSNTNIDHYEGDDDTPIPPIGEQENE